MEEKRKFERRMRVRCIETRKVYPSVREASRQTGMRQDDIYQSIARRQRPGYKPYKCKHALHWEVVGDHEMQRYGCPVRNRDTGEVFPTITAAARHLGMSIGALHNAMNRGHLAKGYRFERVRDYEFRYDTRYVI